MVICTPIAVLGNPEGVTIAQARVKTRVYDVGTEQEPRRGNTIPMGVPHSPISGKSSVGNRLQESIGQTNRVLLNLTGDYNLRHLATDVRHYFENSPSSLEVLIFKGNKKISITRNIAESSGFLKMLLKAFR